MFEQTAMQDPAGFLAAVTEQLAKLPSQLWRTSNDSFRGAATESWCSRGHAAGTEATID